MGQIEKTVRGMRVEDEGKGGRGGGVGRAKGVGQE